MKKGVNLDELQVEAEKLVKLLQDREIGLAMWNEAMQERLQKLRDLIRQAGL